MISLHHALSRIAAGEVMPDLGHLDGDTLRDLKKRVRTGEVSKWRGHWYPIAGAHFGIGPLKTCYGLPEIAAYFASWRAAAERQLVDNSVDKSVD